MVDQYCRNVVGARRLEMGPEGNVSMNDRNGVNGITDERSRWILEAPTFPT